MILRECHESPALLDHHITTYIEDIGHVRCWSSEDLISALEQCLGRFWTKPIEIQLFASLRLGKFFGNIGHNPSGSKSTSYL